MSTERLMTVLLGPHLSEKSQRVAEKHNQVVFLVRRDATKTEIREAVQSLFEVEVDSVTTVNQRGKVKRARFSFGRRNDWKKAYVRLAEGHDIDFIGAD
ncbi:MAG: 50S ribosomal protein L23 [Gammaproteobacteria bacterium]|nr:50S ribosomal protein L23 [Gammaproteobacteria bacterium]NNF66959.1 50S ribosomal protein L23 [Gammaproteobacteria bacterium]